jgi:myosin heavy subunit
MYSGGRRASSSMIPLNKQQSEDCRHALAKELYEMMFRYNVHLCNKMSPLTKSQRRSGMFIGMLDIFGFEIMKVNSFEQLCINFTNEVLQFMFNSHIFMREMEVYKSEGIDVASVVFSDNRPILELISKPPHGVLPCLDSTQRMGKLGTDENFVKNLNKQYGDGVQGRTKGKTPHANYEASRFGGDSFTIKHYAGDVKYTGDGFLAKNNDSLTPGLLGFVRTSSNEFLVKLFTQGEGGGGGDDDSDDDEDEDGGGGGRVKGKATAKMGGSTVGSGFQRQMDALQTLLQQTQPHFVRCVKSNMGQVQRLSTLFGFWFFRRNRVSKCIKL